MWQLLGRLLDNPAGSALVFLALAALLVAAGTYGVRAHRSLKARNGEHTAELLKDLDGLGEPRRLGEPFVIPAAKQPVTRELLDAEADKLDARVREAERMAQNAQATAHNVERRNDRHSRILTIVQRELSETRGDLCARLEAVEKQQDKTGTLIQAIAIKLGVEEATGR